MEEIYSCYCNLLLSEEQEYHSVCYGIYYSMYISRSGELGFRAERDIAELKPDESQDEEFGEDVYRRTVKLCSPTCHSFVRNEMR